jgi:SRSO17 transposase
MLRMSEVNEIDHQAMQHMLTEGCVDWQGFGQQIALEANALLGDLDLVVIFDESGFAKKGEASAGVARQWNGRLGKVDNCQVGVFATLCRGDMATLIDSRLYLSEAWCQDDARCRKAAVPEAERQFRSDSQLALAMLIVAHHRGIQFGYVGIDGGYGKDPAFLRNLDAQGCRFEADGHCDQAIYLQDPRPRVPEGSRRGRKPSRGKPKWTSQRIDRWATGSLAAPDLA